MWQTITAIVLVTVLMAATMLTVLWVTARIATDMTERLSQSVSTSFQTVLSPGEIQQADSDRQERVLTPPWEMWDPLAEPNQMEE